MSCSAKWRSEKEMNCSAKWRQRGGNELRCHACHVQQWLNSGRFPQHNYLS
jgi:cytochrome c